MFSAGLYPPIKLSYIFPRELRRVLIMVCFSFYGYTSLKARGFPGDLGVRRSSIVQ